jgi:2-polyprenyl-3-methyl-5-hydroxy-6-metoxy-1,4-benzoquinol methylase
MARRKMRDPVNQPNVEFIDKRGPVSLGLLKGREWIEDPRRFVFSLARYKFVAKMLAGRTNVIEIGCGDAFAAPIVMQEVAKLTVTDFDGEFIKDADQRRTSEYPYKTVVHDFLDGPLPAQDAGPFDAAYSLDVLEHVPAEDEDRFLTNIIAYLADEAIMIVGMPSLESQTHASEGSRAGHINCKSAPDLKAVMERYFNSVFMFSMNDEVIHTGFHKMAHYVIALAAHKR